MTPTLPRHPRVTCPCCKGATFLLVYDEAHPDDPPIRYKCNHCEGKGWVEAEVSSDA